MKVKGDRPCSKDVLIVITDGKDNGNLGISGPVAEASCRRIITVGVGIGSEVLDAELLAIAAGDRRRVFKVDNVQSLITLQDSFCDVIEGTAEPGYSDWYICTEFIVSVYADFATEIV